MKNHKNKFYGKMTPDLLCQLQRLLEVGFDDILTTNYSYELESSAINGSVVSNVFLKKTCCNVIDEEKVEPKFLISSCQNIIFNDVYNRIWHIHGEARKPNSMILGHYYYASLLHRMMGYVEKRKNKYEMKQRNGRRQSIKSWLDSFILGDVYILGFGMDFSEIDLWWLINRKKRENAKVGDVYFYNPIEKEFDEKIELLKLMGIEIVDFNFKINGNDTDTINKQYDTFYQMAIEDIIQKVRSKK